MRNRTPKTPREETPVDVGTLWTMQRGARTSRCALMASSGRWELRVVVGEEILLSERCDRPDDAFTLADGWKQRMVDQGWCQVVPRSGPRGPLSAFPNI